jgi:hypothetical protein
VGLANEPHEAPAHWSAIASPEGRGLKRDLDPAMPKQPNGTPGKKRPAPPVKVMIGRKALTDGRGPWFALRDTSICDPHDQALSRSKTAILPGRSAARPKPREGK